METKKQRPPKVGKFLLLFFLNHSHPETMLGDFDEIYFEILEEKGWILARFWYWSQILITFPSFVINSFYWSAIMLRNYLTIAIRNIRKQKGYSFINISGLAIGMAGCILIALFVFDELSFDKYHEKAGQIYRVGPQYGLSIDDRGAYTAPPMAAALKNEFPEIEQVARFSPWQRNRLVSYKDKQFLEMGLMWADSSIFDVFTIPFIEGNPTTALTQPYSLVFSKSTVLKYFGNENPIGKFISVDGNEDLFQITGIVEDCPANTHFQYDIIGSMETLNFSRTTDSWGSHCYFTYIVLQDNVSPSALEAKLPGFVKKYYGPYFFKEKGKTLMEYFSSENGYYGFWLQPLTDIYLNADIRTETSIRSDSKYIYIFSVIAMFILLIACINFMNLSTAKFSNRSKEVVVRKVLGSNRNQLIQQFVGESVLFSFIAMVIAVFLVYLFLPLFNNFSDKQIIFNIFSNYYIIPLLFGFAIMVGVLAGSYPAFFLSSLRPIRIFKGYADKKKSGNISTRRGLVIFQFVLSIIILSGTFIVYKQLDFMQNKELGFDKERVVVIHRAYSLGQKQNVFKKDLLQHSEIQCISSTDALPGRHFEPNGHLLEGQASTEGKLIYTMYSDDNYAKLLGLNLVEGRFFSNKFPSDSNAVIINEAAVKKLGLTNPIGKRFHKKFGNAKPGDFVNIIGVIKNINFHSLHHKIEPMLIRSLSGANGSYTSIRIAPGNIKETINFIEQKWNELTAGQPFVLTFLDDDLNIQYKAETKTGQIVSIFAILAIFIACLGMFGLISFTTEQRTKEIGIRKTLGANVSSIIYLLTKEIFVLVSIAIIVSFPVAFYLMRHWLENFAYRIVLSPLTFISTAIMILLISLLTVSYQAIKAARSNPINALRYE